MAETTTKRRREKYSKLICLGCRARRIRCVLPDTSIVPSADPQPADKTCQRCQQNGLDCIVDYTTLGRPAQKRNRGDVANPDQQDDSTFNKPGEDFEETITQDVDDFLLLCPDDDESGATTVVSIRKKRPSKKEVSEAMTSAFHLLAALLAKDKHFASSIGSQPLVHQSICELVNDKDAALLDGHLVWHKLRHPDIPALRKLRKEVKIAEAEQLECVSATYLLALLCDIALDVPSLRLASVRALQPSIKAITYHSGQQLLFTLSRNSYTVLALALTSAYRPLALTSSQIASGHALKSVPHVILGKHVACELGYPKAGAQLIRRVKEYDTNEGGLTELMNQCLHWISLSIADDLQYGPFNDWVRRMDPSALECLEALQTAALYHRMPAEMLLAYASISYLTQMVANIRDMTEHWKDLHHLGEVIQGHKVFCDRERQMLDRLLDQRDDVELLGPIISHIADMERHNCHVIVTGTALFFAVMCGAFAQTHHGAIQSEQAVEVSENIISQLLAHEEDDPSRPSHRRFLEDYGSNRTDELEKCLTNFITTVDTLSLNGVSYVGRSRDIVGWLIIVCKDIVEGNAARLKGWGGLHDRIDVQMILLLECARRLESMSVNAGSEDALAKGCVITAGAKLIRSLQRILQGFKKQVAISQRRSNTMSSRSDPTPSTVPEDLPTLSSTVSSEWEMVMADDLFSDWENWPQFDPFDFTDLFGESINFDRADL